MKTIDLEGKPFHFIGIGGIGMSALAYILAKRQLPVSGSDIRSSHITQRLQSVGAQIFIEQQATNLDSLGSRNGKGTRTMSLAVGGNQIDRAVARSLPNPRNQPKFDLPQVICSTAISVSNAEYKAAQERGYPIFHRSDLLAALIKDYQSIAIAGTHGKTTTSSLVGYLLLKAHLDPTIIIGGEVEAWEGNARLGNSPFLVAEVDESDGTLAKHAPTIGVVTNIELDHPDHYQNLDQVINTFKIFARQCGTLIGCLDCETVRQELDPEITYSLYPDKGAVYTVKNVSYSSQGTTAEVWEKGQRLGILSLKLLGQHNLSNALAAVAVGRKLGLAFDTIAEAAATFTGAKRRFELRGECHGITFYDDYAHHPSEIRATLRAARLQKETNEVQRIVAIFQPHRYSRTLTFLAEFATAFTDADLAIVTEIYSAGEANLNAISGQQLAEAIAAHHARVLYQANLAVLSEQLAEILQPGDLALFLGAGNLNQIIPQVIVNYRNRLL